MAPEESKRSNQEGPRLPKGAGDDADDRGGDNGDATDGNDGADANHGDDDDDGDDDDSAVDDDDDNDDYDDDDDDDDGEDDLLSAPVWRSAANHAGVCKELLQIQQESVNNGSEASSVRKEMLTTDWTPETSGSEA